MFITKEYKEEYSTWCNMKQRCFNKHNDCYANYGGRGITISEEWLHDFPRFVQDMGRKPSSKHSIDRIDNDKGYSKENCRWATRKEQNRNHRRNHYIEYNGKRQCVTDWAKEIGITQQALQSRFYKYPVEKALSMPARPDRKKYIEFNGKRLTYDGWAKELNICRSQIERRLKSMPVEKALSVTITEIKQQNKQIRPVIQLTKDGEEIARYFSLTEAGRKTGVNFRNIQQVCNGNRRKAGGFRWQYAKTAQV